MTKTASTSFGRLRTAGVALFATAALAAAPAAAEYPERDIQMIIPFGAGGGSDTLARTIAEVIAELDLLPVNILPENRPGGSGAVGYSTVAKETADPYFIATVSVSFFTTPLLGGSPVSYRDFTPLASIAQSPYIMVAPAAAGYETLDDLKTAGRLTTGTVGVVSDAALLAKLTSNALGVQIDAIPFDGEGEVLAALLGGHVNVGYMNPSEAMSQIQAGTLRPLAISSAERSPAFPDVPTFLELGHDQIVHTQLRGLVMPAGVPAEVVTYWEGILQQVATSDAWKTKYIDRFHDIPDFTDAAGFAEAIATTNARYETLMKELGIIE
ncbi:tripartite tricarboxylate transporter substrate binding protein [Methylobrevis albus]|uniref:Tripartite tricarboxylate transporter substrate binding protein n=1 Tax=Methylobrevis albus TaxID=2793297 RepID=A0A931N017_9HYPH|nr:tripartite tricarboxylate transporter substrate binding protein [Methylobrevis albus]MBH0239605.1 tripartite tricarboxylate transporter substrate binding protein [Methylobrevis albus]